MLTRTANFSCVIADHQSFLDGARQFTLEGEDQPATGWRLALSFRWPVQTESVDEGDLTLVDPAGDTIQAALTGGTAADITDQDGNVNAGQIALTFDVTGGDGGYSGGAGSVEVTGTVAGEGDDSGGSFAGEGALLTVVLAIDAAKQPGPQPEINVPTGTPERYRESGG